MVRRGVLVTSDSSPKIVVVVHGGSRTRLLCRWNYCDRLKPCPYPATISHVYTIVADFGDCSEIGDYIA